MGIGERHEETAPGKRGEEESNLKLPRVKVGFAENRLCFILFKNGFAKTVLKILLVFTKISSFPNQSGFLQPTLNSRRGMRYL